MTTTEAPERVSTELTSAPVYKACGADLKIHRVFILAGAGFETGGSDQGLTLGPGGPLVRILTHPHDICDGFTGVWFRSPASIGVRKFVRPTHGSGCE